MSVNSIIKSTGYIDQSKPTLIFMVGLPGAGKSWYAQNIINRYHNDTVILSSDTVRKECFEDEQDQTHNGEVFEILYGRAKKELINEKNVIIDATNINRKTRAKGIDRFKKLDINFECYVVCTPVKICESYDNSRERKVGKEVIQKFVKMFEIPMLYEGFNKISFIFHREHYQIKLIQNKMINFNQNNHHHLYSLEEHCKRTAENIQNLELYIWNKDKELELLQKSALYHDIGKLYTQSQDEKCESHYYGHNNFGAYVYMCSDEFWFSSLKFSQEIEIVFYINFHDMVFSFNNSTSDKYFKIWGERLYNNLLIFNKADRKASGTYKESEK